VIHDTGLFPTEWLWRFDSLIPSMFETIASIAVILFCLHSIEYILTRLQPGCYADFIESIEDRRKITIYVFNVLISSLVLVCLLWESCWNATESLFGDECEFVHNEYDENESVKLANTVAAMGNLTVVFFSVELIYRTKAHWDLYAHHFFTIYMVFMTTSSIQATFNLHMYRLGFYTILQVATEEPIFVALFVRKLKLNIVAEANYPKMFYFAAFTHYITKIGTTTMIWYYYIAMLTSNDDDVCSPWYLYEVSWYSFLQREGDDFQWRAFAEYSIGIISPIMFLLQMWQGNAFITLGRPRIIGVEENELAAFSKSTESERIVEQTTKEF